MDEKDKKSVFLGDITPNDQSESTSLASKTNNPFLKITKEKERVQPSPEKKRKKISLWGILSLFLVLFFLFVISIVLVMAKGDPNGPLIQAFNIDPSTLKSAIKTLVNMMFGMVAMVLFLLFVFLGFRRFIIRPNDIDKKKLANKSLLISGILFVFTLIFWVSVFQFVSVAVVDATDLKKEIQILPEDYEKKTTPIELTLSAGDISQNLKRRGYTPSLFQWDFDGDQIYETTSQNPTVTHLFVRSGKTTIFLHILLEKGDEATYETTITLPRTIFTVSEEEGAAPFTVQFDASEISEGIQVKSFAWDFDRDGNFDITTSKPFAEHTFTRAGNYNVLLRLIDVNNNIQTFHRTLSVTTDQSLQAIIQATPTLKGVIPLRIQFDGGESASSDAEIQKYEWNFGDGTPLVQGRSTNHVFTTPGNFKTTLTIKDSSGRSSRTTETIIAEKQTNTPTSVITSEPAALNGVISGTVPFTVILDGKDSTDPDKNIIQYEWDLNNDGVFDEINQRIKWTFDEVGDFTALLKVTDSDDNIDTAEVSIKVTDRPIRALFESTPESGPVPLTVKFDASQSVYKNGKIVSYEWDFGDETPPQLSGAHKSHRFTKVGIYKVKMKIFTNDEKTDTITQTIFAREPTIYACFTPSRTEGIAPATVTFNSTCSTGQVVRWEWDFGDGFSQTARTPTHTFETPGTYTVILQVSDENNNVGEYSDVITIKEE